MNSEKSKHTSTSTLPFNTITQDFTPLRSRASSRSSRLSPAHSFRSSCSDDGDDLEEKKEAEGTLEKVTIDSCEKGRPTLAIFEPSPPRLATVSLDEVLSRGLMKSRAGGASTMGSFEEGVEEDERNDDDADDDHIDNENRFMNHRDTFEIMGMRQRPLSDGRHVLVFDRWLQTLYLGKVRAHSIDHLPASSTIITTGVSTSAPTSSYGRDRARNIQIEERVRFESPEHVIGNRAGSRSRVMPIRAFKAVTMTVTTHRHHHRNGPNGPNGPNGLNGSLDSKKESITGLVVVIAFSNQIWGFFVRQDRLLEEGPRWRRWGDAPKESSPNEFPNQDNNKNVVRHLTGCKVGEIVDGGMVVGVGVKSLEGKRKGQVRVWAWSDAAKGEWEVDVVDVLSSWAREEEGDGRGVEIEMEELGTRGRERRERGRRWETEGPDGDVVMRDYSPSLYSDDDDVDDGGKGEGGEGKGECSGTCAYGHGYGSSTCEDPPQIHPQTQTHPHPQTQTHPQSQTHIHWAPQPQTQTHTQENGDGDSDGARGRGLHPHHDHDSASWSQAWLREREGSREGKREGEGVEVWEL